MSSHFKKIAVLMGGPSAEREVSLRSGAAVANGLREAGYEVVKIDVKGPKLRLPKDFDAVFIALHGEFGEDGQVQSASWRSGVFHTRAPGLRRARTPSTRLSASAYFVENSIPTPKYEVLRKGGKRTLSLPVVVKPASQGSSIGVRRVFAETEWEASANEAFSYGDELIVEEYIRGRELTVGMVGEKMRCRS